MIKNRFKLVALASIAALALAACSSGGASKTPGADGGAKPTQVTASKGTKENPVTVGVVGVSGKQWPVFKDLAEKAGIYVELKDFTGYTEQNPATSSGELDLNQFQHLLYLADYNNSSNSNLQPIGATAIYPLALYSTKHKTLAEFPDGAEIAVPDDPTNQARGLGVLESASLIKLKAGTSPLKATIADIDAAASKVKVIAVTADQTARNLDSVDGAIVNNDFVTERGLDPKAALAQDDPASPSARPFINVWVTQDENKTNEVYLKLIEISHSPEVEAALQEQSGGTAVIVKEDAATLQGYLADIQAELKK